jgi:uncharacterized protein
MTCCRNVTITCRQGLLVLPAVLLLFLLAAISRAGTDKSHGLLWEVSKAGTEPAFLFGTIHAEDPDVLQLAQPVLQAFAASQAVVLELLPDVGAMRYASAAMLRTDGRSLSTMIGQSLFTEAATAMQTRGITATVLERMQPWAVAVTLSMPASESGQMLDAMLYERAIQQGKDVYGLETVQEQLGVFASMSVADQVTLLQEAVASFATFDDMYAELLTAYKRRDLDGLMAISDVLMQQGDQRLAGDFQQRLVVDRNHRMVERMRQYLQLGKAFIAVGALHLPGDEGLLNLLEQQGYTVRRIY